MPDSPLVSVIVPTYNRADLVRRAVDSILLQTHRNVEVLVIDDGSTDQTLEVLKEAQARDSRVQPLRNNSPKGCAGARNTGLQQARGEYIAFLDDDDEFLPEKIQTQVEFLQRHPQAGVVVSGAAPAWCQALEAGTHWVELEFWPNKLFQSNRVLCRRAAMEGIAFRSNYMEWRDLAFQLYEHGIGVHLSMDQLARTARSQGSLSRYKEAMLTHALDHAREYCRRSMDRPEHDVFRRYLGVCEKNVANFSLKQGRLWRGARGYAKAFKAYRDVRNLIPFA